MTELINYDPVLRKKKMLILLCGVVIFFLTSMAKVLIPATIFQELLAMKMPVNRISSLGAAFMYAYAASQLVMGCFSDRYGGVRILLIGGWMFALGTMGFPLMNNYYLMIVCRIVTGFGAGTIFLGVAKLLADLFAARFGFALGTVLFFSYFGPTAGTMPMVWLVKTLNWRMAMILPGVAAAVPLLLIMLLMRGTIKPVVGGQTLQPLLAMIKNKYMWYICFASATVYGVYYALAGQIGQKIFVDIFGLTADRASLCIMILTIIVAVNNMLVNGLLKLFRDRRKLVILAGVLLSLTGVLIGKYVFMNDCRAGVFMLATILLAFPAGFFAMFSVVAKEVSPPDYAAMPVAFLNFMAFVFISLYQNITGAVLKSFSHTGVMSFSAEAYSTVFNFFLVGALISLSAALLLPETRGKS